MRTYERFKTIRPPFDDPELVPLLEKHGVILQAESDKRPWFWTLLVSLLPWLLIIGFLVYSSKKF